MSRGSAGAAGARARPPATVDAYIAGFPPKVRRVLRAVRDAARTAAPDAVEKISYGMPAFWQGRTLVYFAAHTGHLGFYPGVEAIGRFAKELARFPTSKGTVRFPFDRPVPLALVKRIVAFRLAAVGGVRKKLVRPAGDSPRGQRPP